MVCISILIVINNKFSLAFSTCLFATSSNMWVEGIIAESCQGRTVGVVIRAPWGLSGASSAKSTCLLTSCSDLRIVRIRAVLSHLWAVLVDPFGPHFVTTMVPPTPHIPTPLFSLMKPFSPQSSPQLFLMSQYFSPFSLPYPTTVTAWSTLAPLGHPAKIPPAYCWNGPYAETPVNTAPFSATIFW